MKKNYFLTSLILIIVFSFLDFSLAAQSIEWQKTYGGSESDVANSIQQTTDGGYIIAGSSRSNDNNVNSNYGWSDYWIVKIDANGNMEWEKNYGGSEFDAPEKIIQTSDEGYIIAGHTSSNDGDISNSDFSSDYWIVKLNQNGELEWEKTFGGSEGDWAYDIQQTTDGGYIVAGQSQSDNGDIIVANGLEDYWVAKLDNVGNIEWSKAYGGSSTDVARAIQQTMDGGYIVVGGSSSIDGDVGNDNGMGLNYWVVKLNQTGDIEWSKAYGGPFLQVAQCVQQTTDGGYIIAGRSATNETGDDTDYWILKLGQQGNIEWEKTLGGSNPEYANSIIQTTNGGYLIAGSSLSTDGDVSENIGLQDYWIVKLGQQGNMEWEKTFGGSIGDSANSIQQTEDGGFIIAGRSQSDDGDVSENFGDPDYWIVKLSPEITDIKTLDNTLDYNIRPNPSNGDFIIDLAEFNKTVQVHIYDLVGNTIFITESDQPQILINGIPKGFYLINVSNEELSAVKKLIVH